MMIGDRHLRIVVDGDDLLRPYPIRPAFRPDPDPQAIPDWAYIAINVTVWLAIPALTAVGILLFILHALMPKIN